MIWECRQKKHPPTDHRGVQRLVCVNCLRSHWFGKEQLFKIHEGLAAFYQSDKLRTVTLFIYAAGSTSPLN